MKILLLLVGKSDSGFVEAGVAEYSRRLGFYLPFEMRVLNDVKKTKSLTENQLKEKEGTFILEALEPGDVCVLLDEKGMELTSVGFSDFLAQKMQAGVKRLVFVIGGAYGFSSAVYEKAVQKLSLSRMTFPHQLVRVIFLEQLYRALTIWKGEPYHHV